LKTQKYQNLDLKFLKLAVENSAYQPYRYAQTLLGERLDQEKGERHLIAAAKAMCPRAMFSLATAQLDLSNESLSELGLDKLKNGEYRRALLRRCSRGSSEESIPCKIYLLQYYLQDYSGIILKSSVFLITFMFALCVISRYS